VEVIADTGVCHRKIQKQQCTNANRGTRIVNIPDWTISHNEAIWFIDVGTFCFPYDETNRTDKEKIKRKEKMWTM